MFLSLSKALGDNAIIPCAASPPKTFCHDHVITSSFFQSIGIAKTDDVASHIVRPFRSSFIQLASGRHTPELVPFHVNTISLLKSTFS